MGDPRATAGVQMSGSDPKQGRVPLETPEQRAERDRFPIPVELVAGVPKLVNVRPRYPRAYVLGLHFEAPDLEAVELHGIQMEHYEQLAVSPIPAVVMNSLRSVILPVAHATLGIELKLLSSVDQRIVVRVHFSECKGRGLRL